MESCNMQLCRICISSGSASCAQMISIFGEDSLWKKITTLADVKIERGDTLPQQVCVPCAQNAISACLFKQKCEEADNFFRQQQLIIHKIDSNTIQNGNEVITLSEGEDEDENENGSVVQKKHHRVRVQQDVNVQHSIGHRKRSADQKQPSITRSRASRVSDDDDGHGDGDDDDNDNDNEDNNHNDNDDVNEEDNDDDDDDDDGDVVGEKLDLNDACRNGDDDGGIDDIGYGASGEILCNPVGMVSDEDGEIKTLNGKQPPFDFHSIRLMQQYMQHQLSKINGVHGGPGAGSGSEAHIDDEDALPLIPEIELITPSEDIGANATIGGVGVGVGLDPTVGSIGAPLRGYQCPSCFQIFEMKQILKAHMQSVHGTSGPVYECNNCKKTYFYKRFLEKHVRRGRCVKKRRNQTRPMQCSDCHVLFPTGHHLGWHKRTGCPSRTAKMPLQQLFKQNIVQYNNFPKRIGVRKPENALYLHNRKLMMANNKRKGRTRIKLDAKKIALAKQLILREATTTVIANELNISRTFAWRLRKSLVNGVSLHERVIDPNAEEQSLTLLVDDGDQQLIEEEEEQQQQQHHHHQQQQQQQEEQQHHLQSQQLQNTEGGSLIKSEQIESDDENDSAMETIAAIRHSKGMEDDADGDDESDDKFERSQAFNKSARIEQQYQMDYQLQVAQQMQQTHHQDNEQQQQQQQQQGNGPMHEAFHKGVHESGASTEEQSNHMNGAISKYQRRRHHQRHHERHYESQHQQFLQSMAAVAQAQRSAEGLVDRLDYRVAASNGNHLQQQPVSLLSQFPPTVAAAIHQLPVNLSIRSIDSLQSNDPPSNTSHNVKKPRKPNVFIDDEKYAMAKLLVAQNSSTMEIARALNVSQMTAWKVRDAIVKGIPLSYRNKREMRSGAASGAGSKQENGTALGPTHTTGELQFSSNDLQFQHQHEQKLHLKKQQQRQQQQQQQQLQRQQQQQQQLQQQQLQLLQQQQQQQQQQQLHHHHIQQQQHQQHQQHHQDTQYPAPPPQALPRPSTSGSKSSGTGTKVVHPRRRLKAAERELRDKEITREILELIKEDSNIQYWKVSARLAEKGYPISPSSVCQKLKSMGIHRRWKPGDKPPMLDMEQLKVAAAAVANANVMNNSSADECYEQQFDMGGAHFLSAFTR